MVEMDVVYEGDLHCRAVHGPSGAALTTDAPTDNQGRGESFSPTDLLATSLAVCMMTVMGIRARNREIDLRGARVHVVKEMAADPRRRVARVALSFDLPSGASPEDRRELEEAARTCPVALSISPELEVDAVFRWRD